MDNSICISIIIITLSVIIICVTATNWNKYNALLTKKSILDYFKWSNYELFTLLNI